MTKLSSVTLMVCSLQFNFAARPRTIVYFSRKTVIYKHAICFELQTAKLSATVSLCDMRSVYKQVVFKLNERKPGTLRSVEAACRPCSALQMALASFPGQNPIENEALSAEGCAGLHLADVGVGDMAGNRATTLMCE